MTDASTVDALIGEVRAQLTEGDETPEASDNLIEWGLDSIGLMRLAARWRREGIDVSFGDLAVRPTLAHWRTLLLAADTENPGPAQAAAAADPVPAGSAAEPGDGDGSFPLAPLQHAYWIGREPGQRLGGVAAHLYTEFDGAGVDPERLARAVGELTRRHPMLRVQVGGEGRQRVLPERPFPPVDVTDLRAEDPVEADRVLERLRQERSHQTLAIEEGQVFGIGLVRLPGGRTRVAVDVDMVAADARSYRLLLAELARAYTTGEALPPAPAYDYRRYLAERDESGAEEVERDARWWRERLDSLPDAPELPTDPRARRPERIGRRAHRLTAGQRDGLAARARAHGVTLAVAFATAYAEVIGAWSANPRFLLNVPLFDRQPLDPAVPGLVGDFTSSVLLSADVSRPEPFAERALGLQAQLHERARHAAFSGVHLLRELGRATGSPVVAPVVFTSALGLGDLFAPEVTDAFGEPVWMISQGPQVVLDAQVTEVAGEVLVNWDVREDLLLPGVADAMFAAFLGLLDRLTDDAEAWTSAVGALLPEKQRRVREQANTAAVSGAAGTAAPTAAARQEPGALLHSGFFAAAARTPEAPALLWGESGTWSYAELADRALRVAGALRAAGTVPGDTVAVSLPKGPEQVAAVLGVLAAGCTYLPIGVDQPEARLRRVLTLAGCRVAVTDRASAAGEGVVVLRPADALGHDGPLPAPHLGDGVPAEALAPAYVLFTSGSTGEPKGVEVGHEAAMNTVTDLIGRYGLGPRDRTLGVSAMEFDLSVFDVFAALTAGGAVVVVCEEERGDARAWAKLVREHAVTVLNCVPVLLDMLLVAAGDAADGGLGDTLGLVLLGGDWVGTDLPGRLAARVPGCRFVALGGTTETAIHSTVYEVEDPDALPASWRAVPYGTPLGGVACRVVDEQGRDRPEWAAGELWIGGAGLARGYRGDPARTADRFVEHDGLRWYRTGDLARYLPGGVLEFLGRADQQVKLRGYRIELGEVEAALAAQPGVKRAVACCSKRNGGSLRAMVEADPGTDEAALREDAGSRLPGYMVPDRVVVRDALPLNRNGKPDRAAIADALWTAGEAAGPAAPSGALEALLLTVWQEILRAPDLGPEDDFISGGGDSVLATRIVARLRDLTQTDAVRVQDVLGSHTVAAMARALLAADPGWEEIAELTLAVASMSPEDLARELASG
ncbi:non-ribosomal peptide synthetase [Streptomyces sp. 8L]|uniref:non-ribosomal peptide synthetase n=1 Tax=Streptomyces sp. 8L TaxID=2877242 RepID=UPI001CD60B06|nr:non-ribosomal peptide synthetase [Streptomyces sp. 8L]MCA1216979.1 amino acid adenylation domain-containing protein [Streptomyces sp. 8L]